MAQRGRENFYRYSTGIVDHGNAALGLLLENELSLNNESIMDFLNRNQHEIYHLYENRRPCCQCVNGILPPTTPQNRVLSYKQITKLINQSGNTLPVHSPRFRQPLCCRPVNTAITLNDMDISLKSCLLVNFASNCKHGTPERLAVQNMVECRNILFAHVNETKMPDIDFQKNFPDVERAILVIAQFCNCENIMRLNLQDTKNRPLDETMLLQYQCRLLSEIAENNKIQEILLELESKMDESNQNMQNQLAAINLKTEGTSSVLKEMQKEQSTSVKNLNERVTDSENHIRADVEESKIHIATKINNLEHQMSQEHGELHGQVKQTENNIKTSIVEAGNMMSKKLEDLRQDAAKREERLHTPLDEIRKQMEKHNTTDQRKNIIAQTESRIKHHSENVNYVKTRAVKEGQVILDQEGILLLVSKGGAGKTTICLQLASMYQHQGYVPLMFIDEEIKQYRDVINPHEKCIVIIDDLFGRTHVEFDDNKHTNILNFLLNLVTINKGIKLIFTIRQNANFFPTFFSEHCIFSESRVLDLDTKCKLSTEEKRDILLKHMASNKVHLCSCQDDKTNYDRSNFCEKQVIQLPDQSIMICKGIFDEIVKNEPYIGFPEACRLFCSEKTFTVLGIKYFNSPTSSLVDKMKDIFVQGLEHPTSMYQYCALVYIALRGYLEAEFANNFEGNEFFKMVLNLFSDKNVKISKTGIEKALEKIEGTLLVKDFVYNYDSNEKTEAWKFKHETIYDAVLISIGDECPDMFLNYAGLYSILRNVKPRTSKSNALDCSVKIYISDDILIKKIESMLNQERSEEYFGLAWDIGEFVRECALVNRNDRFVKKIFELIPLDTFTKDQIEDLFDGLTNSGKDKSIVLYHPDIFKTFKVDWFNLNVTLALCRPKSSTKVDFNEFIGVDDQILLKHLNNISFDDCKTFRRRYMFTVGMHDMGRYMFTVGMQEGNHNFVSRYLTSIPVKQEHPLIDFSLGYEGAVTFLIDGLTNEGTRKDILSFYPDFFKKYLPTYGSLLVVLRLCTIPGESVEDHSNCIVTSEDNFIKIAFSKFRCYINRFSPRSCNSVKLHMKNIGSEIFIFLKRITNKTFVNLLLEKFASCLTKDFPSGELKLIELSALFDGLTDNGKNLEYLQQNYPFFTESIENACQRLKESCNKDQIDTETQ